jgi:hypothetical protein
MVVSGIDRLQEGFLSFRASSVIWMVNGFFLLMTMIVGSLSTGSGRDRQGMIGYLSQFSLAEEKNLATSWEGWCLLLIAILAFERLLHSKRASGCAKQAWLGLAVLAAGLSFDELASIHERAPLLFSSWGLSGSMSSKIPLALPALVILAVTLSGMWRFTDRRRFWLTLCAFMALGSVAFQEHLEHTIVWPWWARGVRFGVEEGTELFGIYLLFCVVVHRSGNSGNATSIAGSLPSSTTLIRLRPAVVLLTLLAFIPLGTLTMSVIEDANYRGVPAAWPPFVLLSLSCMTAWACAEKTAWCRNGFRLISFLAIFFALDQMIVFQRVMDRHLLRGEIAILMFPCMAAACLSIRTLRTRENMILVSMLLSLSLLFAHRWELLAWLVVPLQSLGIYWILTSALATSMASSPIRSGFK